MPAAVKSHRADTHACKLHVRRVTALKVLCELRLERADIRNRLEAAEIMRHNRRKVLPRDHPWNPFT